MSSNTLRMLERPRLSVQNIQAVLNPSGEAPFYMMAPPSGEMSTAGSETTVSEHHLLTEEIRPCVQSAAL